MFLQCTLNARPNHSCISNFTNRKVNAFSSHWFTNKNLYMITKVYLSCTNIDR